VHSVCRILVVEDRPDVLRLLESILSDAGYRCLSAHDPDEAREAIRAGRPNLVVLDVLLGHESGLALASSLAPSNIPIVFITGDHSLEHELVATGRRYLLKPFRGDALLRIIERTLQDEQAQCAPPVADAMGGNKPNRLPPHLRIVK
jgi:DNA-binding response OmpR family regulator